MPARRIREILSSSQIMVDFFIILSSWYTSAYMLSFWLRYDMGGMHYFLLTLAVASTYIIYSACSREIRNSEID